MDEEPGRTVAHPDPGTLGAALPSDADWPARHALAEELETWGYDSIWVAGGSIDRLDRLTEVRDRTTRVPVVSAIVPVDVYPADDITRFAGSAGNRVLLGLGGAHGPHPVRTLSDVLDRLDEADVPASGRMLAALGPRMLELAAARTAGAILQLATPEFVADVRRRIGPGPLLATAQFAAFGGRSGLDQADQVFGFLAGVPAYRRHLNRLGFSDDEIDQRDPRLVKAFVPPVDDPDAVTAAMRDLRTAGADHVTVTVFGPDPIGGLRALAPRRPA